MTNLGFFLFGLLPCLTTKEYVLSLVWRTTVDLPAEYVLVAAFKTGK
jgi:hypothetical protein